MTPPRPRPAAAFATLAAGALAAAGVLAGPLTTASAAPSGAAWVGAWEIAGRDTAAGAFAGTVRISVAPGGRLRIRGHHRFPGRDAEHAFDATAAAGVRLRFDVETDEGAWRVAVEPPERDADPRPSGRWHRDRTVVRTSRWTRLGVGPPTPGAARVAPRRGDDDEWIFADLHATLGTTTAIPLRGRVVEEEGPLPHDGGSPLDLLSQDEIADATLHAAIVSPRGDPLLDLGTIRADDEGYIDAVVRLAPGLIEPGVHRVAIRLDGAPVGKTTARLLAPDAAPTIVRSDVDLTYLDTDFHGAGALLELLGQKAAERTPLPAMELVFPALRRGVGGEEDRPLVFVSGSPRFFKRVLERRMALDRIAHDGLVLKPFKEIAGRRLGSGLDLGGLVGELKEQVGYKLTWLIESRASLPPAAGEVLLGDDSEADFVIYALYHRLTSGELDPDALLAKLDELEVEPTWRRRIARAAPRLLAHLDGRAPVHAIYINATSRPSEAHRIDDWKLPGLTRHHRGAWPLVLSLAREGLVDPAAVDAVKARLLELGQDEAALAAAAHAGVAEGFLDEGDGADGPR